MKQGKKSRKVEKFGEKVGLYFSNGVGEGKKNNLFCLLVYACFLILSFGFSVMAFCFSIPAVLFQHHLSHFDFTLRYFGHLPFVFLRRSVLFLLLCPRFVAFSLIFPLALSFFQRNMSIFISIRLFKGVKYAFFLLFLVCKSRIWDEFQTKLPVKLIFSAKTEILGENFSQGEEKNTSQKVVFAPKVAELDEKGRFWGENDREGMKRKNGLNCRFCNAMK